MTLEDIVPASAHILVIDDEKSVCITCKRILESEGHHVDYVLTGIEGIRMAVEGEFDLVLLDLKMPDISGMEVLENIKSERPEIFVIIITGYATIQTSIEAIKKGAFNYVPKPFTPEELSVAVSNALKSRAMQEENVYLKQQLNQLRDKTGIVGKSKAIEDLKRQILKIAYSNYTVMIYGESGSGKELVAQAIHHSSQRADKPFVPVDVSSLAPTLLESELFGHVKGAFTGALQKRSGYFVVANGGTLFLDEISNLSLEIQGKLLRALETKKIRPVGSETTIETDVRIVAATNRDLYQLVEAGKYREDLYYRLNVIPLTVPSLRERADDIPLLAMYFLRKAGEEDNRLVKGFTTSAMAKMMAYQWPGNVRELKNVVERLIATADSEFIDEKHLPAEITGRTESAITLSTADVPTTVDELKNAKKVLKEAIYTQVEREFVIKALESSNWNVSAAAKLVGMQRSNFHSLMRKTGVRKE
ncbi:MAG: sigma-54-dependent Fis family transcriptional regulator [Deltaproteobacteria bacterium]|nr:sigma-54-dependent Fis family transcriptional regulator [Deltaproteobacteria bacterium]